MCSLVRVSFTSRTTRSFVFDVFALFLLLKRRRGKRQLQHSRKKERHHHKTMISYRSHRCILFSFRPRALVAALTALLLLLLASSISHSFSPRSLYPLPHHPPLMTVVAMSSSNTDNSNSNAAFDTEGAAGAGRHPFCDLPGDPSLILTTNIDLGERKMEIMKGVYSFDAFEKIAFRLGLDRNASASHRTTLSTSVVDRCGFFHLALSAVIAISKAMAQHTGKPESYIGALQWRHESCLEQRRFSHHENAFDRFSPFCRSGPIGGTWFCERVFSNATCAHFDSGPMFRP
jgi:hypothetical protein